MNLKQFTCMAGTALILLLTGCFTPSTINEHPRNLANTDDKIISDMRQQGLRKANPFYLNEISSKAMRSFVSSYWNAINPKWVKYSGGYVVYFLKDGIRHKVYYTGAGDVQCIIRTYSVKEMPREIRTLVEDAYHDYSIFHVNEVTLMNKSSYEIKVEDEDSFKEIKIENGKMEVTRDLVKSR